MVSSLYRSLGDRKHCATNSDPNLPLTKVRFWPLGDGIWNAVDGYPGRPVAFWFEFLGMLTILFGVLVDQIEKDGMTFPGFLAYGFSTVTLLGILAMPVGGGWLEFRDSNRLRR